MAAGGAETNSDTKHIPSAPTSCQVPRKIEVFEIVRALGGKPSGHNSWMCLCPCHADHRPSLHIWLEDGEIRWHCFAGCTQQAVRDALIALGLWPDKGRKIHLSEAERAKWQKRKEEKKEEKKRLQKKARYKAQKIFAQARQVQDHPYLLHKGIKGTYDLRVGKYQDSDNALLVPLTDIEGRLWTLEYILPDGTKRFLADGKKQGNFWKIDKREDGPLLVCEGLATGLSLHESTGYSVVCAMDCGNLLPVCRILRKNSPSREIIVCADDDYRTDGNPGLTKARQAAQTIGAKLAIPRFKDQEHRGTDFNDLHRIEGVETVKAQIENVLTTEPLKKTEEGHETSLPCLLPAPIDAFPDDLKDVIEALHQAHGTSYEVATTAILAIAGGLIGWSRQLVVKDGWYVHASLYAATEAETGEGKSPTTDFLLEPVERLEHQEFLKWKEAKENYDKELDKWKAQKKDTRGEPPIKPPPRKRTNLGTGK